MNEKYVENIKKYLGANYNENDNNVLEEIIKEVQSVASNISNMQKTDERLFPYVKKAVAAIYLKRGSEGSSSRTEGSISSSYEDTMEKMRNDIIKAGLRRIR